jgi:hypothetical protein
MDLSARKSNNNFSAVAIIRIFMSTREPTREDRLHAIAYHYCNPAESTYNHFSAAMAAAGYKKSYIQRKGAIIKVSEDFQRIKEHTEKKFAAKTALNIEHIQNEHSRLQQLAELKGDLATATRNLEDLGKTIAAYEEKVQHTDGGLTLNFKSEKEEPKPEGEVNTVKIA